ncbi:MAG: site-specific integrase [Rhodocyclaceae bacterium]|nr:site-specific integrase [Rhodocyclaceae bacterium]
MTRIEKGIYKRGPYSFQAKVRVGSITVTATFDTLAEARAYRDKTKADIALDPNAKLVLEARVKKREAEALTLDQALQRYETEITATKKSAVKEKSRIAKLRRSKHVHKSFYRVSPEDILAILAEIRHEQAGPKQGLPVSDTTKRLYAMLLSHLFNIARKRWRLRIDNPVRLIELPKPGASRTRRLEGDEENRLFRELAKGKQAAIMVPLFRFAIETAARLGELLKLDWSDIKTSEQQGTMLLRDTKNGEDRIVPLTQDAVMHLRALPSPIKSGRVFPVQEKNVRDARNFALARAGIKDFRFHDLRHEATSRFFELGLDSMEASAITGHKTLSMLKRYTHLRPDDLAKKMNKYIEMRYEATKTSPSQNQ